MAGETASRLHVFVCGGTGLVGSALVKQLQNAETSSSSSLSSATRVRLVGFCSSKLVTSTDSPASPLSIAGDVISDAEIETCVGVQHEHVCVVDCTSSQSITDRYASWLERGWHVVTCNKKGNSGDLAYYQRCIDATHRVGGGKWFVEATCGAGLPTISSMRTLVATGDNIESVQGIFSGTMSFLFNTWDGVSPFSEIVTQAKAAGYTEPDPREDLNGLDVARKVVICARECGMKISLADVQVESMVPKELESCSSDEFMVKFAEHDENLAKVAKSADAEGCVLRFVGAVDVKNGVASVSLSKFPKSNPFATLTGADNIFEIKSSRYGPTGGSTPLIIRGPGAGAEVTAGGVYGDIVALARQI